MQFRYPGKGNFGPHRGPPGDLRVTVSVQPDRFFERKGADVYVEVPVTITQAILGGTIEVPTLKGEVNVKVRQEKNVAECYTLPLSQEWTPNTCSWLHVAVL